MFLRFSKGQFRNGIRDYRKCVFLGDSVVMEIEDKIVGVAKLHEENEKCLDYDVIVAKRNISLSAEKIARCIKDMIGRANKFSANPSNKRRKYFVEEVECDHIPVNAKIVFSKA